MKTRRGQSMMVGQLLVLIAVPLASIGCAGSATNLIVDDRLQGPVSLTKGVYDDRGSLLWTEHHLEKRGDFSAKRRFWSVFYFVSLSGDWNITELANQAMNRYEGEAIVELSVRAVTSPVLFVSLFLPIVPGYVDVTLAGNVVRRTERDSTD